VINGIAVEPPEDDSDEAILEAVRLVLEKDPFVDASQIRVGVKNALVRLTGLVPTEAEREMAEFDAWYVSGVDKVDNRSRSIAHDDARSGAVDDRHLSVCG
jgi:osmotically-inducible protein OsmY